MLIKCTRMGVFENLNVMGARTFTGYCPGSLIVSKQKKPKKNTLCSLKPS